MNYPEIIEHLKKIPSPTQETCRMLNQPHGCGTCLVFKMSGQKRKAHGAYGGWGCREYFNNNREKIIQHFVALHRKQKLSRLLDK